MTDANPKPPTGVDIVKLDPAMHSSVNALNDGNALNDSNALDDVKAVLLDMDGTLVDSDAAVERAWRQWCRATGAPAAEALRIHAGKPAATTIRQLFPTWSEADVATSAQLQLDLQYEDLHDVTAAAGADSLLEVVDRRGLPWAVVTSADRRLATARLTAAGLDAPLVITSDDAKRGKPEPDGYLLAATKLGVTSEGCLVVEDALAGIQAGERAGMLTAGLRGVGGAIPIDDLSHMARLLSGVGR